MAPPHFQESVGGGTSCAQRTSWKYGNFPPAVRHQKLPPQLFLVRARATPSVPTTRSFLRFRVSRGLPGSTRLHRLPELGSRTFHGPRAPGPGASHGAPSKVYIVGIWPIGVVGGRVVPPHIREDPGEPPCVHSP